MPLFFAFDLETLFQLIEIRNIYEETLEAASSSLIAEWSISSVLIVASSFSILFPFSCHTLENEVSQTLFLTNKTHKFTIQIAGDGISTSSIPGLSAFLQKETDSVSLTDY